MNIDLVDSAYDRIFDLIDDEIDDMDAEDRAAVLAKIQIEIGGRLDDIEDELDDE